jgi:two-component system sensor histidine kinase RegB
MSEMHGSLAREAPAPAPGRVRVRTLVATRWIAVGGQIVTLLAVSEGLGAPLPMTSAMAAVGCSAALNLWVMLRRGLNGWHSDGEAALFLAYDVLQLSALLYLTGGLNNPFSMLVVAPIAISASTLSLGSTLALLLLAFGCLSLLMPLHLPLPWPGGGLDLPQVYVMGMWTALSLGMAFVAFYAWRVAEEARRMSDALAATQLALAREQELSSLGGLAAAAAHELGTPLGTIALVAKELAREIDGTDEIAEDIRLLNGQAERCREILARLAHNPQGQAEASLGIMKLGALLLAAAEPHRREGKRLEVERISIDSSPEPMLRRSPELLQGLANLIDNAMDFARAEVRLRASWSREDVLLEIDDDGPGFALEVLGLLGEPYVSTRRGVGGMGLGVFISKTLLERTGGSLSFRNRPRGRGATVAIAWPRGTIEAS